MPNIIHCTECKHAHLTSEGECKYCNKIEGEHYFPKGFYCSMGEYKDSHINPEEVYKVLRKHGLTGEVRHKETNVEGVFLISHYIRDNTSKMVMKFWTPDAVTDMPDHTVYIITKNDLEKRITEILSEYESV